MLPFLSLPAILGGIVSAYLAGQASRPLLFFVKPLLGAAGLGAALARPKLSLLSPFRIAGRGLSLVFGFARKDSSNSTVEAFKIALEGELVSMYVRRDVFQNTLSVVYVILFVSGTVVIYKLLVVVIYRVYKDLTNRWAKLQNTSTKPKLTKAQLDAINQILTPAESSLSDNTLSNARNSYKITD